MHSVDLKNIKIRSDLIIESNKVITNSYKENNITVDYIHLNKSDYTTISFKDITDHDNYNNIFFNSLSRIFKTLL